MTFADDPISSRINTANQMIQDGKFREAVDSLEQLEDIDPDYPGFLASYRTARFWLNRSDEISSMPEGKKTADFLMTEWDTYEEYAGDKNMLNTSSYRAAMMNIYYTASRHYGISFMKQENTASVNFDLLLKLGACFIKLENYKKAVETLEYAVNSYNAHAGLLSMLAESFYNLGEVPKSLWYFKEAFFWDPSLINLDLITAEPIQRLVGFIREERKNCYDAREWVPVYGFTTDTLFVRKDIHERQVEFIKEQIYNLEISFQKMNREQIESSNVLPRLLTRYLWLLDYYEFQKYNFENIGQIRDRLIQIDKSLFEEYFRKERR
ncbi:MAG: hypothetical protein FWG13_03085 [Leptospirales bacterium]|nr:hypothetical protein [Leptospirales bacterium]